MSQLSPGYINNAQIIPEDFRPLEEIISNKDRALTMPDHDATVRMD